jgi:hypothetical protein
MVVSSLIWCNDKSPDEMMAHRKNLLHDNIYERRNQFRRATPMR